MQQEDWNTVDKKRKAKAGSRQDAASDSGLQGTNSGAAAAIEVDPDGWEVAPNLVIPAVSKESSGQDLWSEVDTKKTRKGKGTTQHEKNGWDDDDDEDAASSMSDPFGGHKAMSLSRPASAIHRQSGKQADDSHSRQSLKSPSKQTPGDADVQCNKCGRYGHVPANCNDLHCDFCHESGHTIKQCDKHKELLSQQAQAAAKQKQPVGKEGQKTKRQDEQLGKQDQWAAAREAALRRVPTELRMACHWCGRDGHRKLNCPWNQNGPFFEPNIGPRQLGTDRQQASIKSRAPRPGQEATPPQPGKTLPLKPTR